MLFAYIFGLSSLLNVPVIAWRAMIPEAIEITNNIHDTSNIQGQTIIFNRDKELLPKVIVMVITPVASDINNFVTPEAKSKDLLLSIGLFVFTSVHLNTLTIGFAYWL